MYVPVTEISSHRAKLQGLPARTTCMDTERNVGGRDRLVRFGLAAVLSIVSVKWLRSGKRLCGVLAGIGALGFGFNATTGYCGCNDALGVDTAGGEDDIPGPNVPDQSDSDGKSDTVSEKEADADHSEETDHKLSCAACGDPIVPGQSRGPNENDEIVHDDCA
jgi:hypothetical protein